MRFRHLLAAGLIVFLFLTAHAAPASRSSFFQRSWKTENGLPDNAVTTLVQTHDGYFWVGTYGGLARFDGVRFTVFNSASESELQSDRVTCLYEDRKGVLWIGHERGDLTCYRNGKFESQNVHETGVRRKISAIGSDTAGDVWMVSEEGTLVRVRDGAHCALPNNDGVINAAVDGAGQMWIASGGKLAILLNGELKSFTNLSGDSPFGSYIQGICASQDGGLWVVGDNEVRKFNGQTMVEDRGTNPCNATVVSMLETQNGTLAMGTSMEGLYLLRTNGSVLHFDQGSGFPNNWIRCMVEDQEGTLWVGAGSVGLTALRRGKVETLESQDHWQGRAVLSTAAASDGSIWATTEGAGLYRLQDNEWKNYGESSGLSNLFVWSVSQDKQGHIWASTWGGGVFFQKAFKFVRPPGLENVDAPMGATLQTPDGATWIGTVSGLIQYQNGTAKWFGEKEGLKVPDVRAIEQAPDGTIWFGMLGGGLGRLQNGMVKQFQKSDGLASDYVQSLKLDGDGTLWIGTYGSGLNRLKDGKFSKITTDEGLPNNFICTIEDDNRGNFWIGSHHGIFRVGKKSLNECADGKLTSISCLVYGEGDGLPSLECAGGLQPAACKLDDGRICFATSKGLVVVDPSDTKVSQLPPPVVLEDVVVNGRVLHRGASDSSAPVKIPPGQQRFEFHFTGLSFVAPEKMQFEYQLAGWDSDWIKTGNDKRVADYSYLPPNNYTFHVRACNSDGIWNNTGASFSFVVLPHFWQTWWFGVLATVAAIALVASIVWYVSRRRLRRKLENIQRQQAIERERTRIAKDIHDHLGANLTRISLLSQSAQGELENTEQAAEQLERIYETSRELTRSMDEIVWAVNPHHDTLDSLASYLGNFAQEYLTSLRIRCRLEMPLHLPHSPITAETRHNIFLAFKEALHNVVKHSGATEVVVLLTVDTAAVTFVLRDNGKGFAPDSITPAPGRGNGLKNMRQRLEKIGGRCTVNSHPGAGTEISFLLNLVAEVQKTA